MIERQPVKADSQTLEPLGTKVLDRVRVRDIFKGEQERETPVATERQRNSGSPRKEDGMRVAETEGHPLRAVFIGKGESRHTVVNLHVIMVE